MYLYLGIVNKIFSTGGTIDDIRNGTLFTSKAQGTYQGVFSTYFKSIPDIFKSILDVFKSILDVFKCTLDVKRSFKGSASIKNF